MPDRALTPSLNRLDTSRAVEVVDRFTAALEHLENTGDAEPLVACYGDDSTAGNVLAPDSGRGRAGVERFWHEYARTFRTARSSYRSVVVGPTGAALEWVTRADGPHGPVEYAGVTVLEITGDRVTRSMAYFDPRHLGHQVVGARDGTNESGPRASGDRRSPRRFAATDRG